MSKAFSIPWLVTALLATATAFAQQQYEPPSQLSSLLGQDADAGFEKALTPRSFSFPADHGPHPSFRNEWWYVTGNLDDEDGRRFGFELTIFRFALAPSAPVSPSAWRSNQIYIAHLAVTDVEREDFHVAQRYSRGALGLAGAPAAMTAFTSVNNPEYNGRPGGAEANTMYRHTSTDKTNAC